MRHAAVAERRAAGAIDHEYGVFGAGHFDVVDGDVLHDLGGIDALLVAHADEVVKGDSGQGDHGRAVEARIIETI